MNCRHDRVFTIIIMHKEEIVCVSVCVCGRCNVLPPL